MSIDMEKLESVYADVLGIVRRQVEHLNDKDVLEEKEVKSLVELDKILRAGLEFYGNKKPKGPYESDSTEDLLKEFE